MRPYLDSKFSLLSTPVPPGVIFGTARGNTFQKWMYNWPRQLTIYYATGVLSLPGSPSSMASFPLSLTELHFKSCMLTLAGCMQQATLCASALQRQVP